MEAKARKIRVAKVKRRERKGESQKEMRREEEKKKDLS